MLDREIVLWKRAVRRDPTDVEAWSTLLRHVARSGRRDELLADLRPDAEVLDRLWEHVSEDRALAFVLLPFFDLELVTGKGEAPGRYWTDGPRLGDAGDHWFDRVTGLPLEVRRARDGAPMVLVPPGRFQAMQRGQDCVEAPLRRINLGGFWIDRYPVTVERYSVFLEETGHRVPFDFDGQLRRPHQPVVHVSWEDALRYASWAGGRLLGDKAWEKAARGPDGARYPWGEPAFEAGADAVTEAFRAEKRGAPASEGSGEVGRNPERASPYGVQDMAGRVREWCVDLVLHGRTLREGRRIRGNSRKEGAREYPLTATAADEVASFSDVGFRLGRPLAATLERRRPERLARAA